jgi:transcription initiation factor TFIID subunit 5
LGGSGLIGTDKSLSAFNDQGVQLGLLTPDKDFYGDLERALNTQIHSDGPTLLEDVRRILSQPPEEDAPLPTDVPLPPKKMSDIESELSHLRDLRARVQLSDSSLPSICCYTFHNTDQKSY